MSKKKVGRTVGGYYNTSAKKMSQRHGSGINTKSWPDSDYLMTKETKEFVNESSQERNMGKEKLKFLGMSNKSKQVIGFCSLEFCTKKNILFCQRIIPQTM